MAVRKGKRENKWGRPVYVCYQMVEFKPVDGRPVRFTDEVGSLPPDYEEDSAK